MTLRTADPISRKGNNNNVGSDRRKEKFEIYVNNLHPDTSTHEVLSYLKANYSGYFKWEQIRNHFNDYSSFKIEAPLTLKSKLLKKYNWNPDVYVRPFFKKSAITSCVVVLAYLILCSRIFPSISELQLLTVMVFKLLLTLFSNYYVSSLMLYFRKKRGYILMS